MNDKTINSISALVQIRPPDDRAVKASEDREEPFDKHLREEVRDTDLAPSAAEQPTSVRDTEPRAEESRRQNGKSDGQEAATEPVPEEGTVDSATKDATAQSDVAAAQPHQPTADQLSPTTVQTVDNAVAVPTDGLALPADLTALLESDLAADGNAPEAMIVPAEVGAATLGPQTELGLKAMRDLDALLRGGSKGPLAAFALAKGVGAGGTESATGMPPGLEIAAGRLEMNGAGQQSVNGADPLAILDQLADRAVDARTTMRSAPAAMSMAAESRPETAPTQMPSGLGVAGEVGGGAGRMTDATGVRLAQAAQGAEPAARQVAVHIARAVENGSDRIRIQLNPAELGRVDVRMEIANDGRVTAVVAAEKPETLDLLRRDVHALEKALAEAGLKADGGSLQFSLQGEQADQEYQADGGPSDGVADDVDGDLDPATLAAIDAGRWRAVDGVVDITV